MTEYVKLVPLSARMNTIEDFVMSTLQNMVLLNMVKKDISMDGTKDIIATALGN